MRRALAAFTATLLLHSATLQARVFCGRTQPDKQAEHHPTGGAAHSHHVVDKAAHSHHAAPSNTPPDRGRDSHTGAAHCALMAGCGASSLAAAAGPQGVPPAIAEAVAPIARELAPSSLRAAPEPPPPKV